MDPEMFAKEIGVTLLLILEHSVEQTSAKVTKMCHEMDITLEILEESTQHDNLSERYVGLTKTSIWKDPCKSNLPMVLWDFCAEHRMRINDLTPHPLFQIQGQNLHLATFGEEEEIYNVCKFKWYEWTYAMYGDTKLPNQYQFLCRVLGPSKNDGNKMAQ